MESGKALKDRLTRMAKSLRELQTENDTSTALRSMPVETPSRPSGPATIKPQFIGPKNKG